MNLNEYLESIEVGMSIKLTVKKGEKPFFYKGIVLTNNSEESYLVIDDIKNVQVYCKYETILDLEVSNE